MTNNYIETWKKTIKLMIEAESLLKNLTEEEKRKAIMDYARNQYNMIKEQRPNKDLELEKQINIEQEEFINYLKKVIDTGNLENEQN